MALNERYKQADRVNKRALSLQRSKVTEVPLTESFILLPNCKILGVANEVDEFLTLNKNASRYNLILVEQDYKLFLELQKFYKGCYYPYADVVHSKLSDLMREFNGRISYMHADYCSTVNTEASLVLEYMRGKLSPQGAVLRFTHSRRNNYKIFHLIDSKNLIDWLVKTKALSRKAGDNLYYQSLRFQTDPTLRVGIQLIAKQVMSTNTLKDPTQIRIDQESINYTIVDCVVDRYKDTGANMQTMRFVLEPAETDPNSVISSLYTVYNALC